MVPAFEKMLSIEHKSQGTRPAARGVFKLLDRNGKLALSP